MASIVTRHNLDGSTSYQVRWREDGRQTSATAPTMTAARKIKALVDSTGTFRENMVVPGVPTVTEACDTYLATNRRANADTIAGYRTMLERHVTPKLGGLAVTALTRDQVEEWALALDVSDKTRHNVVSLLSSVLARAVQDGHLSRNVAYRLDLRRTDPPRERHLLTIDDLALILDATPERWRPVIATLAGTGLRWGELEALTVGSIRPGDPFRLSVTQAVKHRARQGDAPGVPKTKRSVRPVPLVPDLVPVVLALAEGRPASEPLFVNRVGRRTRRSTFYDSVWTPALDRAQLAGLTWRPRIHDLRAFATTWMIESGVPMHDVADALGHESIDTTFGIYRRTNPMAARRIAAAMSKVLAPALRPRASLPDAEHLEGSVLPE